MFGVCVCVLVRFGCVCFVTGTVVAWVMFSVARGVGECNTSNLHVTGDFKLLPQICDDKVENKTQVLIPTSC